MTRPRALLWALACLAVAYPALAEPVLGIVGQSARWLAGEPTVLLTVTAAGLGCWALAPRRTANPPKPRTT